MSFLQRLLAFLLGLKPLAQEIALRVEKDSEDGWTNEEKMALALEIFQKVVYIAEPWYLKLVPCRVQVSLIKWLIEETCKKVKALKQPK